MITVLAGGAALFALGLAGVLALLGARTAGLRMASLAGALALMFIAFAIIGDRRERRCVDRVPPLRGFGLPEKVADYQDALTECRSGEAFGLQEPF